MSTLFRGYVVLWCLAAYLAVTMLPGCSSQTPMAVAETAEQRAFAAYGTFVIVQEQAAALMGSASVPNSVKRGIQEADRAAKPVADAVLDSAMELAFLRATATADSPELREQSDRLSRSLDRLINATADLIRVIREET